MPNYELKRGIELFTSTELLPIRKFANLPVCHIANHETLSFSEQFDLMP